MNTDQPIRVGVAGVRGYKGTETARVIAGHPRFRVAMVASDVVAGGRLRDIDRDLVRDGDAQAVGYNDTVSAAVDCGVELMFLATRPLLCAQLTAEFLARGVRVVDLSGAHCIRDDDDHFGAYGFPRPEAALSAVYGLTELADPAALASARLVANPTSYATAVLLALEPLLAAGIIDPERIVVDVKASSSAAGRKARIALLHSELATDCAPNKIDRHPHTPEISAQLRAETGAGFRFTLVSHIVPVARGVLATCYLDVPGASSVDAAAERVAETLQARYRGAPFVRVRERAEQVHLRGVVGTNRVLLGAAPDPVGGRVIVVAALDNLLKGTAGQAVQNANLMFGLDATAALGLGTGGLP